jgi:hypothetical protein
MKGRILIVLSLLMTVACTNNRLKRDSAADSISVASDINLHTSKPLCFIRVEGESNQDTSFINLKMNGEDVTGEFKHLPHEKDSRIGTLKGKRKGNEIKALWSFIQEGMNDTLSIELKLRENQLLQKSYSIDPVRGRQFTSDTSRYTIIYNKIDCQSFN